MELIWIKRKSWQHNREINIPAQGTPDLTPPLATAAVENYIIKLVIVHKRDIHYMILYTSVACVVRSTHSGQSGHNIQFHYFFQFQ